jgi:hypothetical protein
LTLIFICSPPFFFTIGKKESHRKRNGEVFGRHRHFAIPTYASSGICWQLRRATCVTLRGEAPVRHLPCAATPRELMRVHAGVSGSADFAMPAEPAPHMRATDA